MNNNHFEQFYDNYTRMMLFARSNQLKLENTKLEIDEIKRACSEIMENGDILSSLNSLKGLKSVLNKMHEEIKAILYRYGEIDDMINQIDILISDYYEMDIEIDLYELNGIEKDLLSVKGENDKFNALKLEIDMLDQTIDNKINELKHYE